MARNESSRKAKAGTPLPEIPDKLYFRIGEVARLLALPAYVLRFWESEFPHLKPSKGGTGQRLYRRRDLDTLLEIRRLLYEQGYTIPGARQFLKERPGVAAAVPLLAEAQPAPAARISPDTMKIPAMERLRAELRALADLLARPVPGVHGNNPAYRGLHLAAKKRATEHASPTLFAMRRDSSEEGSAE